MNERRRARAAGPRTRTRPALPLRRLITSLVVMLAVGLVATTTVSPSQAASALSAGGWTTTVSVSPTAATRGAALTVTVRVTSTTARSALIDLEVYSAAGTRMHQRVWDQQSFGAGT